MPDSSNTTDSKVETLILEARRLAKEDIWDKLAIQVNTQIIELAPNRDDAYTRRGICYHQLGRLEEAEEDFDEATELNPNNRTALRRLEQVWEELEALSKDAELRELWRAQGLQWSSDSFFDPKLDRDFGGFREETPLHELGYNVTKLSRKQRWQILTEEELPKLGLHEVSYTIASNCRLRKSTNPSRHTHAIKEWEYDLDKLRACANRRVACVTRVSGEAVRSL